MLYETACMSWRHALSASQLGLVSAALRHVDDARRLLSDSPTEALYLSGYGPECVRKAALVRREGREEDLRNRAIGHRFDAPAETTLRLFCDLDPLAPRYALQNWKQRFTVLGEWKEEVRYARSDSVAPAKARRLLAVAQDLTVTTVARLWADGRLEALDTLTAVAS